MTVPARPVALAVAVAFAALALTGRAALLVRPWFVPVLLATSVVIAAAAIWMRGRLPAGTAFALLLPVVVGVTLTPGVAAKVSQGPADTSTLAARVGDPANPLLAGRGGQVTLLQILLAEQQGGGVVLAGRHVSVEARTAGPHRLERAVIVCCAADAQTVSLPVTGPALPRPGNWVRVQGRLETDGTRTVLAATRVSPIPTPVDPFL